MVNDELLEELQQALCHLNNAVEISEEEGLEKFALRLKYLRDKCSLLMSRLSEDSEDDV